MVLDEPASALDTETERLLVDSLARLRAGKTTLIISHRLSTVRHADKIVVIQDGRLAEEGSHDELLERRGMYAHLYDLQNGLKTTGPEPAKESSLRSRRPTLSIADCEDKGGLTTQTMTISNSQSAIRNPQSEGPQSAIGLTLWMLKYALRRWPGMLAALVTMLLGVAVDVLRPWPLKLLVDNVLGGKPLPASLAPLVNSLPGESSSDGLLIWVVGTTVALFLLGWLLSVATTYTNISFGQRMVYDLAEDLFAHLQRLSLRFHSRKSVGDSVRRVTTDSSSVSAIVKDALFPMVSALVSLCIVFAIMWGMDRELTLLALLVVPGLVVTLKAYAGPMMRYSYEQQEAEGQMFSVVEETLSAIPAVQVFSGEERADARLGTASDEATRGLTERYARATAIQGHIRLDNRPRHRGPYLRWRTARAGREPHYRQHYRVSGLSCVALWAP